MKAMVLDRIAPFDVKNPPLRMADLPDPVPRENEILIRVSACGVCHTELDEIEGRTPPARLPVVLGHQIVGRVEARGDQAKRFKLGERVGVGWIHSACGTCKFCIEGQENLCTWFKATGRDVDGGYAELAVVPEGFAYRIPRIFTDTEAAPLLCAGAIGYRSLRLTGIRDGQNLGLMGFGASAHLVLMMVKETLPNSKVFVFARSEKERDFAGELGAVWAGPPEERSPEKLDCIIDTTPVWNTVVKALENLQSGGRLVINAIRKEEVDKDSLLLIHYPTHLWMEKEIKSVANVSRGDIDGFLEVAGKIPIRPEVQEFALEEANLALAEIKERKIRGAKVLRLR